MRYLGGDVDKVKLTYKISDEYISNDDSEYAENCLDLQGIKRYNIFRYFDEINMLLPVATQFDEESNTLSAETDELGTYCVLDMEVLMQNFGIEPTSLASPQYVVMAPVASFEEENTEDTENEAPAEENSEEIPKEAPDYNVIFIIDDRSSVITKEQFAKIKEEILAFAETAVAEKHHLTISIYKQSASDFTQSCCKFIGSYNSKDYNYESIGDLSDYIGELSESQLSEGDLFGENCIISDGLIAAPDGVSAPDSCIENSKNYIFDIFGQKNAVYDVESESRILDINANVSIISDTTSLTGFQSKLVTETKGTVLDYNTNFAGEIYKHIFDQEYTYKEIPTYKYNSELETILATGLQKVTLNSELYANGNNPSGEDTDTDMDGLTDWDEVDFKHWEKIGLITYDEKHNVILPTLSQCMELTDKPYVKAGLDRYSWSYVEQLMSKNIMPISSDPTNADGDFDGLLDSYERRERLEPLNADIDRDGLNDAEEERYKTNPWIADSDYDGLDDKYEIENNINPLNRDTDYDGFNDNVDREPDKYNVDWENLATELFVTQTQFSIDYLDGVIRGDFIREPNLAQLIGMIHGSFIPFIDVRDVVAGILNNDWAGAALSGVGLIPAAGDIAKLVVKVSDFIITGAKHADEISLLLKYINEFAPALLDALKKSDNFSDVLKHIPCKEAIELYPNNGAIKKLLALPSNSEKYADEVVCTFKEVVEADSLDLFEVFVENADYDTVSECVEEYEQLVLKVSEFSESIQTAVKYAERPVALEIVVESSKYGEIVPKAINEWGVDGFYVISQQIEESGVSYDVAYELYNVWFEYGEQFTRALAISGIKNTKHIIELRSKLISDQFRWILKLAETYGSNVITALAKQSSEDFPMIQKAINLCENHTETIILLLRTLVNHSDTMIKAINVCGVDNYKTISDYCKIFDKFGDNAEHIVNKFMVEKFVGLEEALDSKLPTVCFAKPNYSNEICVVTASGINQYNPTITSLDEELEKNSSQNYYYREYSKLLTKEEVEQQLKSGIIKNEAIANEMNNFIDAINTARNNAKVFVDNSPELVSLPYCFEEKTKIPNDYSFVKGRPITNCAEIWCARELILHGYKFKEWTMESYFNTGRAGRVGLVNPPCVNCCNVFNFKIE